MLVMFLACDDRFWEAKLVGEPLPPIPLLPPASVEFLVEVGRLDMQLKGIDAYNRAVFLVHPSNLKCVLPVLDYIIVEFIPGGQVSETRAVQRIRNLRTERLYQKVDAASLGPGKAAIGLKNRR
jgi:hypothetical protein